MGVEVRRGPSLLAITVLILIMLLHAHICRAASPVSGNSSTSGSGRCNSDQGEWLVGDIASEAEFLMDSETNRRMLASNPSSITYPVVNTAEKAAAKSCGRSNRRYCVPPKNKPPRFNPKCGPFNRECNRPMKL